MRLLTVDPGLTGALALFDPATPGVVTVEDMPAVSDEVDVALLLAILRRWKPDEALIERVGPRPTDGSVQAFKFGGAYRTITTVMAMLEIPARYVTPQTWKKHLGLSGSTDPKEDSRKLVLQRFPACASSFARKKDHNRAEAALLALYWREKMMVEVEQPTRKPRTKVA